MSSTYTRLLWEEFGLPGGYTAGPVVPGDELWVIRCVTLYLPAGDCGRYTGKALVLDGAGVPVAGVGGADSTAKRVFVDEDLRQVLNPGDQLAFEGDASEWQLRVTGFVFAAP